MSKTVRGRFAPSPSGRMHLGNVCCALLAYLAARSSGGEFILRMEDLDTGRCHPPYDRWILDDLAWLGLSWDEGPDCGGPCGPYTQSLCGELYAEAIRRLSERGLTYPCFCSRADLAAAQAPHLEDGTVRYDGRCSRLNEAARRQLAEKKRPALRLRVGAADVAFIDGLQGAQRSVLADSCGDFVLRRADGLAAYQLAVVVDDGRMGVTQVVRGGTYWLPPRGSCIFTGCWGMSRLPFSIFPFWSRPMGGGSPSGNTTWIWARSGHGSGGRSRYWPHRLPVRADRAARAHRHGGIDRTFPVGSHPTGRYYREPGAVLAALGSIWPVSSGREEGIPMALSYDANAYRFPSRRKVTYATRGMVCCSQPLAAQAGLDVLKAGGNAIDAAVAAAACMTVVEPTSNGIGSDAFALIFTGGKLYGLNGSGPAPLAATAAKVRALGHKTMPERGWIPVNVPGAPSAWAKAVGRFGRLPLKKVLEPAAEIAQRGARRNPDGSGDVERIVRFLFQKFGADPAFQAWFDTFAAQGRAPRCGEIWRSPDHAATLRELGETECESFYRGALAAKIARASREQGGVPAGGGSCGLRGSVASAHPCHLSRL